MTSVGNHAYHSTNYPGKGLGQAARPTRLGDYCALTADAGRVDIATYPDAGPLVQREAAGVYTARAKGKERGDFTTAHLETIIANVAARDVQQAGALIESLRGNK